MLNITIGFVFTQALFLDDQGKTHVHRALTDADKPWISVLRVLRLLTNALRVGAPKNPQRYFQTIRVRIDYKTVHYDQLLTSLREKLTAAFARSEIMLENENKFEKLSFFDESPPFKARLPDESDDARHSPLERRAGMDEMSLELSRGFKKNTIVFAKRKDRMGKLATVAIGKAAKKRGVPPKRARSFVARQAASHWARGDPFLSWRRAPSIEVDKEVVVSH